jgi:hypothetical protein
MPSAPSASSYFVSRDDASQRYTAVRDVNPRVASAGWRVYDSYLKANRVEAGTTSYDEVVRLVLGLRVNGRPALDGR